MRLCTTRDLSLEHISSRGEGWLVNNTRPSLTPWPSNDCITPWGTVDKETESRLEPRGSRAMKEEDKTFKASFAPREDLIFIWQTRRPSGQTVDIGNIFAIDKKWVAQSLMIYFWSSTCITFPILSMIDNKYFFINHWFPKADEQWIKTRCRE